MAELTQAQRQAVAIASARLRLKQKKAAAPQVSNAESKGNRELSWGDTGIDVAKSLGSGLVRGVTGLAGLPGDISNLTIAGLGKLHGQSPEEVSRIQSTNPIPGSADITGFVERNVTGPLHESQSTLGDYAGTVGEFAPAAIAGPGSLARKAAMTVIPGVASEGAGQLTKGTAAEPYARLGGALLGGITSAGGKGNAMKQMREAAPTFEKVAAEKNALYGALNNAGIKFDANSFDGMMISLASKLKLFRATRAPLSTDAVDNMSNFMGKSPTFQEVEDMLVEAKGILREPNASNADKAAAHILVDELSSFFEKSPLMSNGSIAPGDVAAMAKQARELARRHIIAGQVNKMIDKSEWYLSGSESGLRNQFSSFGKKQGKTGLTEAEKKAAKRVTNREGGLSVLNQAGTKLGQLVLGGVGFAGGGPVGVGLALGGHMAARKTSEALTKKSVADFIKTTLAGREAQAKALMKSKKSGNDAMTRRLASANSAIVSSRGNEPVFFTDAKGRNYDRNGRLLSP